MPNSFYQLPADSTGKRVRTRERTENAVLVHDQFVAASAMPTWWVWSTAQALAANKIFLAMLNNAGSGQVIKVRKLFFINAALAAIAGIGVQFDIKRITAITGGTAITPQLLDSTDTALTNFTCVYAPTSATEGAVLFPWYTNNDEIGLTGGFPQATIQALFPQTIEGPELKELELQPGEGLCVKLLTSTTLGSMGILAAITRE